MHLLCYVVSTMILWQVCLVSVPYYAVKACHLRLALIRYNHNAFK